MSSVLDWHEIALISNIWYRTFCQAGRGLVRHTYLLPLSKLASAPSSHRCGSLRNIVLLSPHLSIGYLRPSLWQCPLYSLLFDIHHCQGLQRCEAADRQPTDLFWLARAKMGQLHIKAEFLTSFKKKVDEVATLALCSCQYWLGRNSGCPFREKEFSSLSQSPEIPTDLYLSTSFIDVTCPTSMDICIFPLTKINESTGG